MTVDHSIKTNTATRIPSLSEVTRFLDKDGKSPLLQSRQNLIQALIDEKCESINEEELKLSGFMVEVGTVVAFLTGRSILMLTHCVWWAKQAQHFLRIISGHLFSQFGERKINMKIKVPVEKDYSDEELADVVLTHGISHLKFKSGQVTLHQDLGNAWDGVIRTSLENPDSHYSD